MQAAQKKSSRHAQYSKFPLDVRPFLFKSPAERSPYEQQLAYLADLQVDEQITKIKWENHFKDEKKKKEFFETRRETRRTAKLKAIRRVHKKRIKDLELEERMKFRYR